MPETPDSYRIFLGEFFWAQAYELQNNPYHGRDGWTRGYNSIIPNPIRSTTETYRQESGGFDCSIEQHISIHLPVDLIANQMNLRWNGSDGSLYDSQGQLIAFDPSAISDAPGALLVAKEPFLRFLDDNQYDVLWAGSGQKTILGGRMLQEVYKRRLKFKGAYRIRNGMIEGETQARFLGPNK